MLHDPVIWTAFFANGDIRSSEWDSFSDVQDVDGVTLYYSREPIKRIQVARNLATYALELDEPACCFAFHRWRSTPSHGGQWLYSSFGYVCEDYRVILQVSSSMGCVLVQKRTSPFQLAPLPTL